MFPHFITAFTTWLAENKDVLSARTRGDLFDWTPTSEEEYLRACVAGFAQDYGPMITVLKRCAA